MIEITANPIAVPNNNLQKLLSSNELIKALARQLVAGQVEGHIDMMNDFMTEYRTFNEVDGCVQGAKETVVDYIEDMLAEFRTSLLAEVGNTVIETKSIQIDKDGLVDAVVVVS